MKLQSTAIPIEGPRKVRILPESNGTYAILTADGVTLASRLDYFGARDKVRASGWQLVENK